MQKPFLESLLFHALIVVLLFISSWGIFARKHTVPDEMPIVVQLAPIGEKTNLKPAPKQEIKKPEPKPEPKKPEPKPEPKKPEPKKPEKKPEPKKPEPKKPEADELDKLLKDLDKTKTENTKSSDKDKTKADSKADAPYDPNSPEAVAEIDYIKKLITDQIRECWSPPAGVRDAKNLIVRVNVDIAMDGNMKFVGFDDSGQNSSDPTYQAAQDSARRAVLDPECNPLRQLPPTDKFYIWKEMTLNFDPRDLIY